VIRIACSGHVCTTLIATISKDNKKREIGNTGATEPKIRIDVRGT